MKIISMHCPNCNASLDIPDNSNIKTFVCNSCQSTLSLFQNESISSLEILSKGIQKVSENTNIVASELTLQRLQNELSELLSKEDSFLYMISGIDLCSSDYYFSEYHSTNLSEAFKTPIKYSIENIYAERTNNRIKFNQTLDKNDIKKCFVFPEDYHQLINSIKTFVERENNRIFSNSRQIEYVKIYISRIEEYIETKNKINLKQLKIKEVKKSLIS